MNFAEEVFPSKSNDPVKIFFPYRPNGSILGVSIEILLPTRNRGSSCLLTFLSFCAYRWPVLPVCR